MKKQQRQHRPTQQFIKDITRMKEDYFQTAQQPQTKEKELWVKIKTKNTDKLKLETSDFIISMNECLFELSEQTQRPTTYYEKREVILQRLFEGYFAFLFFAREYNWLIPQEIKEYEGIVRQYMGEYLLDNNTPAFANFGK